jgi:hypothetical protein
MIEIGPNLRDLLGVLEGLAVVAFALWRMTR